MKKNDFPTNPVAFAQYVWENIEVGDTLVDRLRNFWKVTSYETYNGRKIRINICCIDSESCTGCNNGDYKKLTRYDLARKYFLYIDSTVVEIPKIEDWNVKTFIQNYNTLYNILETMIPITTEEKSDVYALFSLTQEVDKKCEDENKKISAIRSLDELKSKLEKCDYNGDKIREKCVNCLPKEDKKMTELEKNYLLKNKGKTGADNQLKSAFYSIDEQCPQLMDTLLSALGGTICACEKVKNFMKSCYDENKTTENKTASSKNKVTYLKSSLNLNDKVKGDETTPPIQPNQKSEEIYKENIYKEKFDDFPFLDKYVNNKDEANKNNNNDVDFINRPFHIGDIVVLVNGETGYISKISHRNNTYYYYYIPIVIVPASVSTKTKVVGGLETKLNPTLEFYLRVGNWDLTSSLMRASLRKFEEFKDLTPNYVHVNDKKDSNTSTTDASTPSSSRENLTISSLPNYINKLKFTDSSYNYEVNTKLTTDTAEKLNKIIESLNDIIRYLQETERKRQQEER